MGVSQGLRGLNLEPNLDDSQYQQQGKASKRGVQVDGLWELKRPARKKPKSTAVAQHPSLWWVTAATRRDFLGQLCCCSIPEVVGQGRRQPRGNLKPSYRDAYTQQKTVLGSSSALRELISSPAQKPVLYATMAYLQSWHSPATEPQPLINPTPSTLNLNIRRSSKWRS